MDQTADAYIEFLDNSLVQKLVGPGNQHINFIEKHLQVAIVMRGNIFGVRAQDEKLASHGVSILKALYEHVAQGRDLDVHQIETYIRNGGALHKVGERDIQIVTKRTTIVPRTQNQASYIAALQQHPLVFGIGPAGTGKTYLAVAVAVSKLITGEVKKLVLTRPAVEAGEKLGFLPGDMKEKVDPYLKPIYDALNDMLPAQEIAKRLEEGQIEIAPLAFMRGRTLSHAAIILDEAQNTTPMQMKMFLTRLGENASMVITGDVTQIDLLGNQESGLIDAQKKLKHIKDIKFIELTDVDIVRHPLVSKIVRAYTNT